MGNYYRNAHVVFSCLSAFVSTAGILRPRSLQSSAQLGSGLRIRHARPSWEQMFRDSALTKRAWAFQERLLSTRTIHFENDELFWECLEVSAREGSFVETSGLWNGTDWRQESLKRCLAFDHVIVPDVQPDRIVQDLLLRQWYRVLSQYTTTTMTRSKDILNASGGIAQKLTEATRFAYVAGIWYEDVLASLLWYCKSTQKKPAQYLAPAWSWASLVGAKAQLYNLESQRIDSSLLADILHIRSEAAAFKGSYGEVISAYLTLETRHFVARCQSSSNFGDPYLQQVIDIFSEAGAFIGTGYLDDSRAEAITRCTAIVISQRMDPTLGCVTYFLLIDQHSTDQETFVRIGVGQTADTTYGYATNTLDVERLERRISKVV